MQSSCTPPKQSAQSEENYFSIPRHVLVFSDRISESLKERITAMMAKTKSETVEDFLLYIAENDPVKLTGLIHALDTFSIKYLVDKLNYNMEDKNKLLAECMRLAGWNCLIKNFWAAILDKDKKMLDWLLKHQELLAKDFQNNPLTLLTLAIPYLKNLNNIHFFFEQWALAQEQAGNKKTLLHHAVEELAVKNRAETEYAKIVKLAVYLVMTMPSSLSVKDNNNHTPLDIAIPEVKRWLQNLYFDLHHYKTYLTCKAGFFSQGSIFYGENFPAELINETFNIMKKETFQRMDNISSLSESQEPTPTQCRVH